jgi:aminoglycoside/choline kinase family phosphotransferase
MSSVESRAEARRCFVDTTDWRGRAIATLAADASFRCYYRVAGVPSAVLMDAPPAHEDVHPFMALTGYLRGLGLSAPEIYAADIQNGFLLLEDMGDMRVSQRLLARPEEDRALYEQAIDILAHVQAAGPVERLPVAGAEPYDVPPYDMAALEREVALLPEWFVEQGLETRLKDEDHARYMALWRPLLDQVAPARRCVVLRDYHVDNLMCLPGRLHMAGLGLLDYQDALLGHPAYDLVSLLEDARRDVPKALRAAMLNRYLEVGGAADIATLKHHFNILGAQRNAKIIGIFARLSRRDGKHGYLGMIPRVWRLLEEDLDRLGAGGLTAWLNDHAPRQWRGRPLPLPVNGKRN